jgi:hypothetical protein
MPKMEDLVSLRPAGHATIIHDASEGIPMYEPHQRGPNDLEFFLGFALGLLIAAITVYILVA